MKIAIVVAGVIVVAAAVLVAVQPSFLKPASLALVQKSDILGFSPGMTFDETNKLITQRRYRCRQLRAIAAATAAYLLMRASRRDNQHREHGMRRVHVDRPRPPALGAAPLVYLADILLEEFCRQRGLHTIDLAALDALLVAVTIFCISHAAEDNRFAAGTALGHRCPHARS
jgi:hypothetical protein